jgi:hypothetical protein
MMWGRAWRTAAGMSFISMLTMELAETTVELALTGGAPCHICTATGPTPSPHLHRDWTRPMAASTPGPPCTRPSLPYGCPCPCSCVGGTASCGTSSFWLALPPALLAGFLCPLPYNYYMLRKYGQSCH